MKTAIIGRDKEIERLERYMNSNRSEFIVVYGRRRIGKTFLVRELLNDRIFFRMTAKENATTREQLRNFSYAFKKASGKDADPVDWDDAFRLLTSYIETDLSGREKILFMDELPWFDTYDAKFISALEHFWNDWADYRRDIKLIVCGSATTWMLDKIVNSRGGLHNRATHTILLQPFSLKEVELYFHSLDFSYERQEILECYMAMGGVPYYLSLFEQGKSVAQNIESLCFTRDGELVDEFRKVFRSLFKKSYRHLSVITALHKKGMGMTRQEIITATSQTNNGNLTALLRELEYCGFIRSYIPFNKTKRDMIYQIIDPFILFYFRFMHEQSIVGDYWQKMQHTNVYASWCGYAFEIVCLNHLDQIVRALGVDGSINKPCSWTYRPSNAILEDEDADDDLRHGAQIDLLIDRSDKTITVCEMKYSGDLYEISKSYDALLNRRLRVFRKITKTPKSLQTTFITPHGLADNMYARRIFRQVTGEHLFV